jgi:UDP-glucose 4-epimerase
MGEVEFRAGDVRSRADVRALLAGADAVVHLAFAVHGRRATSDSINVGGSRVVFEETARSGAKRLCYASSIGAYGGDHGFDPLGEDAPLRGTTGHDYSEQKAAVEGLLAETLRESEVDAYALRLSIVAGPKAQLMLRQIPWVRIGAAMPARLRGAWPSWLRPVLPDTGVPLQVVHEDDAAAAFLAAVLGRGKPGPYNVAAAGTVTVSDLARRLGWLPLRVPRRAVDAAARLVRRLPPLPGLAWLEIARAPVLVRTERAREQLGWTPRMSAEETLDALVGAYQQGAAAT